MRNSYDVDYVAAFSHTSNFPSSSVTWIGITTVAGITSSDRRVPVQLIGVAMPSPELSFQLCRWRLLRLPR
jgi:hypothetical protein